MLQLIIILFGFSFERELSSIMCGSLYVWSFGEALHLEVLLPLLA